MSNRDTSGGALVEAAFFWHQRILDRNAELGYPQDRYYVDEPMLALAESLADCLTEGAFAAMSPADRKYFTWLLQEIPEVHKALDLDEYRDVLHGLVPQLRTYPRALEPSTAAFVKGQDLVLELIFCREAGEDVDAKHPSVIEAGSWLVTPEYFEGLKHEQRRSASVLAGTHSTIGSLPGLVDYLASTAEGRTVLREVRRGAAMTAVSAEQFEQQNDWLPPSAPLRQVHSAFLAWRGDSDLSEEGIAASAEAVRRMVAGMKADGFLEQLAAAPRTRENIRSGIRSDVAFESQLREAVGSDPQLTRALDAITTGFGHGDLQL